MFEIPKKETIRDAVSGAGAIFENAGGPMFITDPKTGEILECNIESERLIGRTRAEVIKMNQSKLFPRDLEKTYREKFLNIKKGSITDFEAKVQHKDGNIIPVLISAQVFSFGDKDLIMGFYTDINPRKEQKERIKRFNHHLDKSQTEFISLVSHQMRAPILIINWYSETLLSGEMGKLKDEQKKYFKVIYENSQKMINLINSLLNVSRIELGTLAITLVPTDIAKSADIVLTQFKSQIDEKKIKFSKTYESDLPLVPIDPDVIKIIFKSLISNAVKYTPEDGAVDLDISKKDQSMIIKVTDTGYGIPKNQQSKIFTKLFRADNITDKDAVGTGLGLYIIKSILDQSGGKIEFESTENKGSSFWVTIPLTGIKKKIGTKGLS